MQGLKRARSGREAVIMGVLILTVGLAVIGLGGAAKAIAAQVRQAESHVAERMLAAAGVPR